MPIQVERLKQEAAEFNRYSLRLWVALSLVMSLAAIAVLSKKHLVNPFGIYLAALILPASLALYFKNAIALLGPWVYAAVLIVMRSAAVLFGT